MKLPNLNQRIFNASLFSASIFSASLFSGSLSSLLKALGLTLLIGLTMTACTQEQKQAAAGSVQVVDYSGAVVRLEQPARRVVTLAPHAAENLFSAGGGDRLVGVMAYSDYPAEVAELPVVGSFQAINFEQILGLDPDLIIAWQSGTPDKSVQRLKELGFAVYLDEPKTLSDVARSIRDMGVLAGTPAQAAVKAQDFEDTLAALAEQYQTQAPVSVFYEIWNSPLQTINGDHIISDMIRLCGGENIFAGSPAVAPVINVEAVLARDPQAIIGGGEGEARPAWLDEWQAWPRLSAVQNNALFHINPDHTHRHTTRLLKGAQKMCAQLHRVREVL